jgi:hypothetical protein
VITQHPPETSRRGAIRIGNLALVAVYIAVAVAATWPLTASLATALPVGTEQAPTVPLFNAWTVWWNADRAAHGFQHYWDAPIFHPARMTFAFSEAQPTLLVVAPLVWMAGSSTLAYNVYLLATLALSGWCADLLLRRVGLSHWSAVCGGVMVEVLPFVFWQLGALQLTVLWGALWTTLALWSFAASPSWGRALWLGVAFAITYAACNYYGLFLAVVLGPSAVWMLRIPWKTTGQGAHPPRVVLQLLLAAGTAAALVAPIVSVQLRASQQPREKWRREWSTVRDLSAHLRDYTDTPWRQWLDTWEDDTQHRADVWTLGPGWLKIIAAGLGVVCGLARRSLRRWTLVALSMGGLALFYSLGPLLEVWNLTPYRALFDYVPGFAQIRSPFRFAVFVQLACVWLSAIAVDSLCPHNWWRAERVREWIGRQRVLRRRLWTLVVWIPAVALGSCLICETLPTPQRLQAMPSTASPPLWVEYLRDETPPGAPVVHLPFVRGKGLTDYESTTWWMWWSGVHRRPLLNGYSGFFPDAYLVLQDELRSFPDKGAPRLAEMGAQYAIVQRGGWTQAVLERHPQTSHWIWQFSDEVERIDVYEIPPVAP